LAVLETGMITVARLADTLINNYESRKQSIEPFFQRSTYSTHFEKANIPKLRKLLRDFLEKSEKESVELMFPFEKDSAAYPAIAGISMFYFEDESTT
jgi:hypothetical protein